TNVVVCFDYSPDGRLTVQASLPEIQRELTMNLNRAAGLSDSEMSLWTDRLDQGLSDAMLADLPDDRGEDQTLEQEQGVPSGETTPDESISTKSAAILGIPAVKVADDNTPAETGIANNVVIQPVAVAETKPSFSIDEAQKALDIQTPERVEENPKLDVGEPTAKADASDLQALAALGIGPTDPKPSAAIIPSIVTTPSHPKDESKAKSKKSSGLFGRKK
ncbi:MAG: hypothetical protein AAGJ83_06635, partial [Planctomycetota bacterium]